MTDPFTIWCPTCGARPDRPCTTGSGRGMVKAHKGRITKARRADEGPAPAATPAKRTNSPISPTARAEVRQRSRGLCEASTPDCPPGPHAGNQHHHVVPRGRGGKNTSANLLWLCPDAHGWVHDHPAAARDAGLLLGRR